MRRRREALLARLGGKCVKCGSTVHLTFDHIRGIQWDASRMSSHQRLKRYEQEVDEGLLQLLCFPCNQKKGRPAAAEPEEGEPF